MITIHLTNSCSKVWFLMYLTLYLFRLEVIFGIILTFERKTHTQWFSSSVGLGDHMQCLGSNAGQPLQSKCLTHCLISPAQALALKNVYKISRSGEISNPEYYIIRHYIAWLKIYICEAQKYLSIYYFIWWFFRIFLCNQDLVIK